MLERLTRFFEARIEYFGGNLFRTRRLTKERKLEKCLEAIRQTFLPAQDWSEESIDRDLTSLIKNLDDAIVLGVLFKFLSMFFVFSSGVLFAVFFLCGFWLFAGIIGIVSLVVGVAVYSRGEFFFANAAFSLAMLEMATDSEHFLDADELRQFEAVTWVRKGKSEIKRGSLYFV